MWLYTSRPGDVTCPVCAVMSSSFNIAVFHGMNVLVCAGSLATVDAAV